MLPVSAPPSPRIIFRAKWCHSSIFLLTILSLFVWTQHLFVPTEHHLSRPKSKGFQFSPREHQRLKEKRSNKTKEGANFCALFFVYGHVPRYENEAVQQMQRLKTLNPKMTTIMVTDNPSLQDESPAAIDILQIISRPKFSFQRFLGIFGIKEFSTRLYYISTVFEWAPSCDMVLSLDSHVTVCSSNLYEKLEELYSNPSFFIGTNVENAPHWKMSSFAFLEKHMKYNLLPHNYAIAYTPESIPFVKQWYQFMKSWKTFFQYQQDDQRPLAHLLQEPGAPPFTRLPEHLFLGSKSIHKGKYGFYPRFTYVYEESNITLVHSYRSPGLPEGVTDICEVYQQPTSEPRMMLWHSLEDSYHIVKSAQQCEAELSHIDEKQLCRDPGHLYALSSKSSRDRWLNGP